MSDADRIRHILHKRTSLKGQITSLTNAVNDNRLNSTNLRLRITRLTKLFRAYEELNDELSVLESDDYNLNEFLEIQNSFYDIAAKIEDSISSSNGSSSSNSVVSVDSENTSSSASQNKIPSSNSSFKRHFNLSTTKLPNFDGSCG